MNKILLILTLFIFSCDEEDIRGCTDSTACNYTADATIDNNSCKYVSDCNGVCGGNSSTDLCGICDGDNSTCLDECGVPNGDNSTAQIVQV